jgi:SAM-dependent methyltransferase
VTATYEHDVDNPLVYRNEMGDYKTGRQLSFIRSVLPTGKQRILDVGGGGGRLALPLAELGHDVTVLDVSAEALTLLATRSAGRIEGIQGGLMSFAPDRTFDVVLAVDMLKYVTGPSTKEILAKLGSFLPADGILVVCEINRASWRNRLSERVGRREGRDYNIETADGYRAALADADLEPFREEGLMWMPLPFNSDSRAVKPMAVIESSLRLRRLVRQSPWLLIAARRRRGLDDHHFDERHYLEERFHPERQQRSLPMRVYYGVKPLLPRRLQIAMRRIYAKRQMRTEFPRWPIEPLLVERRRAELKSELSSQSADRLATLANWPDGNRFASILTHDVEGPAGVANVPKIIELERRQGFVSSWNFVAEWYPIDSGLFDYVRSSGGEIGLHGIKHDCRLFESRENFEAELPKIHRYLHEWGAVGFRSPATHRNVDWMPELGSLYDSSFPDTDPFEPQAGGCCSILPFFLDEMVELPITLVQDHTLWEILQEDSIDLWTTKAEWIIENGGLVNLITHPDYLDTPARLRMYEEFLAYLSEQRDAWHTLPRDVAAWWRIRDRLGIVGDPGDPRIEGEGAERARLAWVCQDGDVVRLEPELMAA